MMTPRRRKAPSTKTVSIFLWIEASLIWATAALSPPAERLFYRTRSESPRWPPTRPCLRNHCWGKNHCGNRRRTASFPIGTSFVQCLSLHASETSLDVPSDENEVEKTQQSDSADIHRRANHPNDAISRHLENASSAASKKDGQRREAEVEMAERVLLQWAEAFRARGTNPSDAISLVPPGAQVFTDVIRALVSMPYSFVGLQEPDNSFSPGRDGEAEGGALDNQIRTILGKGKGRSNNVSVDINTKSDRATKLLDIMESFHEPTGSIYDAIIASYGSDVLECLSKLTTQQWSNEVESWDDERISEAAGRGSERSSQIHGEYSPPLSIDTPLYRQAWKSAKAALQLLDRSEELYRETGRETSRLPSISSYVTLMDVWKALAVSAESDEKKREEALDTVRNVRQRRLDAYSLDAEQTSNVHPNEKYCILPPWLVTVDEVWHFASDLLRDREPQYQLEPVVTDGDDSEEQPLQKLGTWHFNQLIFDLSKYPQPFSGPLAQDLLEFMVSMVKSPPQQTNEPNQHKLKNPNVPKPNIDTINGVLKAWMVTPNCADAARRAEAILARLAMWQDEGTLWGVHPDVVSYNTCINCWKRSDYYGAAERATDILRLLEEGSGILPDVISYASCIGAWAECASREPKAGRRAEEILTRMYQRSREQREGLDDKVSRSLLPSTLPKPTTRCFNAVLLAYANSREHGGGKRALDLLRFMERLHSEGYVDVQPDTYTLNIVMKALTNCGEPGAAQKATQLLRQMENSYSNGDITLKPNLLSYNTVLNALGQNGDAESAENLLKEMYSKSESGTRSTGISKPNAYSYTAVLNAWTKSPDKAIAVRRAEDLFNDLERKYAAGETDIRADTSVYNALINCWAKSGERKALYRVTQILDLMEELGLQGGDSDVQPNSRTYCSVLDTLSRSKDWKAPKQSLEILQRMENFYLDGYESVRPCARAYSIVISTIARSRKKGKALKAQEILHRMESEYRKGNIAARPTVFSYNAVLNAAAYTSGDEREQEQAFKVACLTFEELANSDYLKPSHVSYGTFLKAIKHLMPRSDVRDDLVKSVFRSCCRDGQVGDLVLRNMKGLSSPEFYQTLLEGVADYGLPKSWSANVRERDAALRT